MNKDEKNKEMMNRLLNAVWEETNSFQIAFNVHVDFLRKLTLDDEDSNKKYEVATRIVNMTVRHLKEDDISREERMECELLLIFYQFLQALYEMRFHPHITQAYVDRLAEIYNEKRMALDVPDTSENCDFLFAGTKWDYVDFDKYKLIKG